MFKALVKAGGDVAGFMAALLDGTESAQVALGIVRQATGISYTDAGVSRLRSLLGVQVDRQAICRKNAAGNKSKTRSRRWA